MNSILISSLPFHIDMNLYFNSIYFNHLIYVMLADYLATSLFLNLGQIDQNKVFQYFFIHYLQVTINYNY